jgi:hypothetical protein
MVIFAVVSLESSWAANTTKGETESAGMLNERAYMLPRWIDPTAGACFIP